MELHPDKTQGSPRKRAGKSVRGDGLLLGNMCSGHSRATVHIVHVVGNNPQETCTSQDRLNPSMETEVRQEILPTSHGVIGSWQLLRERAELGKGMSRLQSTLYETLN